MAYGPVVAAFTLGSGAEMVFRRGGEVESLYVEPGSLYIMSGDARSKWTHEMPGRKSDMVDGKKIPRGRRISVTFRNVPR
jgi:alkylated DNA repair dioxygenase AlkB